MKRLIGTRPNLSLIPFLAKDARQHAGQAYDEEPSPLQNHCQLDKVTMRKEDGVPMQGISPYSLYYSGCELNRMTYKPLNCGVR